MREAYFGGLAFLPFCLPRDLTDALLAQDNGEHIAPGGIVCGLMLSRWQQSRHNLGYVIANSNSQNEVGTRHRCVLVPTVFGEFTCRTFATPALLSLSP